MKEWDVPLTTPSPQPGKGDKRKKEEDNHYFHTGAIDGVKHFALLPFSQAAETCFGTDKWPEDVPAPTSWIEFDVEDIEAATKELEAAGYKLFVAAHKEP